MTLHPLTLGLVALALLLSGVALILALRRGAAPGMRGMSRRLREIHRDSDAPAFQVDRDGRIVWANRAAEAAGLQLGEQAETVIGRLFEITGDALYRLTRGAARIGFALAPVEEHETRQRRYLAAQSPCGISTFFSAQPAEDDPLRSLVQPGNSFEGAPIGHVSVAADGRISTNPRFRELFGAPAKSILDRLPGDRPPEGGRVVLPMADGRDALVRVFTLGNPATQQTDYLFYRTSDDGGHITGPAAALEGIPVALLQLDIDGRILWSNSAARSLLGGDALIGNSLSDLVEPLGRPVAAVVQDALSDGDQARPEMVRIERDGIASFIQISLTRARIDENDALVAVLSDASEIRQLEDQFAQSQKMEAVGKLAGGVAHDFNNVLTAISGHGDLLLLGKDVSHPDYSDLMQIRQNANRAAALVRQLLAFSRKQTLSPEDLSLRDVISDTHYLLDRLIGENVTLHLDQARDLGAVRADRQQLEQALMNLVVNARDAMPEGGTVTIATRNLTLESEASFGRTLVPPGDYVELRVEDEGRGLPEHAIDRVFDPFFTTKPMGEGTGLGLSTVYGVVRQSGGHVTASNRPGGGAMFRILLPRITAEPVRPVDLPAPASERADMTGKGVVLLVEDEAPVRTFATRALQLRGYHVEAAETAERAMQFLSDENNHVDLIVSDVVMPGLDGPGFAEKARKLRPGLPVIFVSGYAEDSFRKTLVDDFLFLPKPFSLTELTAKVKEALR